MMECPKPLELHRFQKYGRNLALSTHHLLLFELDDLGAKILDLCDGRPREQIIDALKGKYPVDEVSQTLEDFEKAGIIRDNLPTQPDISSPSSYPITSIDLHVVHDCNLRCIYCYGEQGTYHGNTCYMSKEIAEAGVKLLLEKSGESKGCTIVFFGGEPLLNFPLIRHIVDFSRKKALNSEKTIHFTMTTNGLLLSDEIIEYLNAEKIGVMISIDGKKEIQDKLRPHMNAGISSYDLGLPNIQRFIKSRNGRVTARATITPVNLDLTSCRRSPLLIRNEMENQEGITKYELRSTKYEFVIRNS